MWANTDQGTPLSPTEAAYWVDDAKLGDTLYAYNVEVTAVGCESVSIPILATDSIDAITRAFELMYPNWDEDKPKSGMKIRVVSFERRKS